MYDNICECLCHKTLVLFPTSYILSIFDQRSSNIKELSREYLDKTKSCLQNIKDLIQGRGYADSIKFYTSSEIRLLYMQNTKDWAKSKTSLITTYYLVISRIDPILNLLA